MRVETCAGSKAQSRVAATLAGAGGGTPAQGGPLLYVMLRSGLAGQPQTSRTALSLRRIVIAPQTPEESAGGTQATGGGESNVGHQLWVRSRVRGFKLRQGRRLKPGAQVQ
jgi:hypothetical protein